MNMDETTLYHYIQEKNAAGEVVTYSTLIRDKALNRSNPTVFKIMNELLSDGKLRGEYLVSTSGHNHLALFVNEGEDEHLKYLIKRQINETVKLRLTIEGFMTGELSKKDKGAIWRSLTEFEGI